MDSTSQPLPASVSSTKAATDSLSVAAYMVTKDAVRVSISSVLPNKGTLSGAFCDISLLGRGVGVRDGGRQSLISTWRWAFGSVRRVLSQSTRARAAPGRQRVRPHGRTSPHACSHVSGSGIGQLQWPGQSTRPYECFRGGSAPGQPDGEKRESRWRR